MYTHKRESVRFFEQTICSARRIDHSTCLEASPIRIFDAIPTFSRLFEATINVSNGTSGDDLRLETGLRSSLTTPQRDGEAANCIPISLTRILSCLRTSTWVKRSLIPPLLESLRIRFRFSSIFHSLSLLSVVREYRYRRTGYGIWRLLEIIIFRGTAKTGDSRKSRIKIYNRVGRERGEEARSRRKKFHWRKVFSDFCVSNFGVSFRINRIYLPFNIPDNKYRISRVSINLQFTKKQESQEASKLYPEENLRL